MPQIDTRFLLSKTGAVGQIEKTESGAINDIVIFSHNGKKSVLRCRTREDIFGYEKGFLKEPLISALLAAAKPFEPAHNERVLTEALQRLQNNPVGTAPSAPPLPRTLSYNHSRTGLPFLWMIQEYAAGPLLQDCASEDEWYKLGYAIGKLHAVQLEKAGPFDGRDQTPGRRLQTMIDDIRKKSPVPVLREFNIESLAKGTLSLCHGDVHCRNVIVGQPTVIIDWDNASADFPELDLVKPLHWCAIDAKGFFIPHAAYYAAYLRGYENAYGQPPDPGRLALYELSWLCRIYQFERQRETAGRAPAPPSPSAESYLERIKILVSAA